MNDAQASPTIDIPPFMHQIVEEAVAQARKSPHINQASGVSVRTSIACLENMVSSAERRGILTGEDRVMPRVCDLAHILSSMRGKIELMLADEGDATEDKLVVSLLGEAVKKVFDHAADVEEFDAITDQFETGLKLAVGDDVSADDQIASMKHVDGLLEAARSLTKRLQLDPKDTQALAAVGEFLLEALYAHNRLSKHASTEGASYGR